MSHQRINPLLKLVDCIVKYDTNKGLLSLVKTGRPLFPDESGNAVVWVGTEKKLLKIKYEKLCYYLAHGKVPSSQEKILHKNLDTSDYRLSNLVIVPREKFREIKESIMNIEDHLRIQPHPSDQYSYFVYYRKDKQNKRVLCGDIIEAQKLERSLRLQFLKLITKYCNTET